MAIAPRAQWRAPQRNRIWEMQNTAVAMLDNEGAEGASSSASSLVVMGIVTLEMSKRRHHVTRSTNVHITFAN